MFPKTVLLYNSKVNLASIVVVKPSTYSDLYSGHFFAAVRVTAVQSRFDIVKDRAIWSYKIQHSTSTSVQ